MDDDVINLRDQVAVLRRRWRVIALSVVVALGVVTAAAMVLTPTYAATAEVLVGPVAGDGSSSGEEVLAQEEVATQVEVVTSRAIAAQVRQTLGLTTDLPDLLDSVTVEPVEDTRVLAITAERSSPEGAVAVANTFASIYLRERAARAADQGQLTAQALQSRYDDLLAQLRGVLVQQQGLAEGPELAALEAQENDLSVQMATLQRRLAVAETADGGEQAAGELLVSAATPQAPVQRYLVPVGLALGLLFGIGLAFVREHFDDAIRDEARLRSVLDRPVLARVPHWPDAGEGRLATMLAPDGPTGEAYRSLTSALRSLSSAPPSGGDPPWPEHRVVLVTSPGVGEGKTTVACNLAVAAARYGFAVIAVDADLRNPGLAHSFGLDTPRGLSELLVGGGELDSYLLDVGVENLRILPGGTVPPNPAELLASAAADEIIGSLRDRAALVIVDSGSITPVVDARELLPLVDDVVLVVRHAVTRARAAAEAVEQIRQVGGAVSGVVLNDTQPPRGRQGYRHRQPRETARRVLSRVRPTATTAPRRATTVRAALNRSRGS